jgi:hypothetical protein
MKLFYPDFSAINAFTMSLNFHQNELECRHCLKSDQFVSHGIVYKQRSGSVTEKVGKRLFCSNRYGRSGCGRTFQLYIASEIPAFRYGAAHLFVFISALIANQTISEAYMQATGQTEYKNAWQWLKRLTFKLSEYRTFLKCRVKTPSNISSSPSHFLRHLLPTLIRLFSPTNNGCFDYQMTQQRAFF